MKIQSQLKKWSVPGILGIASFLALVAWSGNPPLSGGETVRFQDTIPTEKRSDDSRKSPSRDFDRELEQLEKASYQMKAFSDKDFEEMRKNIERSIKEIDLQKIELEVQAALQKVNIEKIQKDVENAMKEINTEKIEKDIEMAMKEVAAIDKQELIKELEQAKAEIKKATNNDEFKKAFQEIKAIDMKEISKEMEEAKKEMANIKINLESEKMNIRKELEEAHSGIEKARKTMKGYQEMVYDMENQGLLKTSEDYVIEFRAGVISVNGKKLDEAQNRKYQKYFGDEKGTKTIKKTSGDLIIEDN